MTGLDKEEDSPREERNRLRMTERGKKEEKAKFWGS